MEREGKGRDMEGREGREVLASSEQAADCLTPALYATTFTIILLHYYSHASVYTKPNTGNSQTQHCNIAK